MKSIFDWAEDRGRIEGRIEGEIKGEIKAIKTVVSLRFQESSRRLNSLLTKFDSPKTLDRVYKFALTATSLLEVEDFAEKLTQKKANVKSVAKKKTCAPSV